MCFGPRRQVLWLKVEIPKREMTWIGGQEADIVTRFMYLPRDDIAARYFLRKCTVGAANESIASMVELRMNRSHILRCDQEKTECTPVR